MEENKKFRVIFMGSNEAAIRGLEAILKSGFAADVLVVTPPKKTRSWHQSLRTYALQKQLKLISPNDINDDSSFNAMRDFMPDFIFSVYYTQILKRRSLELPTHQAINVHPSLLPRYRGVAPLIWAIINGETKTGISAHVMHEKVDTGTILKQVSVAILPSDTGYSLHQKIANEMGPFMTSLLRDLKKNPDMRGTEPRGISSHYLQSQSSSMNHIRWSDEAKHIHNIIRALTKPLPGAFAMLNGEQIFIWRSEVSQKKISDSSTPPGQISVIHGIPTVSTGAGTISLISFSTKHGTIPTLKDGDIFQ